MEHFIKSDRMPPLQLAYHSGSSTETAVFEVLSDVIDAANSQKVTLLSLLDVKAAFDTVDYPILLKLLEVT